MSRSGYTDYDDCDEDAEKNHEAWRKTVSESFKSKEGQTFLKEMLAAFDALPQKRLIANVLQDAEWNEDGDKLVPVKDGDVCAFGAVGRMRGVEMPAELGLDDDDYDDEPYAEVQSLFGTDEHLTREIMYQNDECDRGRRVPIPNVRRDNWDSWGYDILDETPEERFIRMHKWIATRIKKELPDSTGTDGEKAQGSSE